MALIKCRECGKEVSSKAEKCPHCGVAVRVSADARARSFKVSGSLSMIVGTVAGIAGADWGFGLLAIGFVLFVIGRAFQ